MLIYKPNKPDATGPVIAQQETRTDCAHVRITGKLREQRERSTPISCPVCRCSGPNSERKRERASACFAEDERPGQLWFIPLHIIPFFWVPDEVRGHCVDMPSDR